MARFVVVQTEIHEKADSDHSVPYDSVEYNCDACGLSIVEIGNGKYVHGFEPVDESEFL